MAGGGAFCLAFIAAAAATASAPALAFSPAALGVATPASSISATPQSCRSRSPLVLVQRRVRVAIPSNLFVSLSSSAAAADCGNTAPPPSSSSSSNPALTFREWSDRAGLRAPKLERASDPSGDGVPGLAVVQSSRHSATSSGTDGDGPPRCNSVEAGEAAVILPLGAALVVLAEDDDGAVDVEDLNGTGAGTSRHGTCTGTTASPVPDIIDDRNWSAAPPQLRLTALLLSERRLMPTEGGGSAGSNWEGYIRHLPPVSGPGRERCETLCRWTDAELALLRSPALTARTKRRRAEEGGWYGRLMPAAESEEKIAVAGSKEEEKVVGRAEFDWAVDVVRTRHFRGDFAPGHREQGGPEERMDDVALLPFIDDLNHRGTAAATGGTTASPSREFFPVKDCLVRAHDAIRWVALRAHLPGDEVALLYLNGPDAIAEAFLDEWGFVPSPDCMDACAVYVGDVRCVIRANGRLEDEGKRVDAIRKELRVVCSQQQQKQGMPTSESVMARDKEEYGALTMAMPSDAEVWHSIAKACFTEAAVFESTLNAASGIQEEEARLDRVSARRRTIAENFVEGKWRLLRSGMKYALCRI